MWAVLELDRPGDSIPAADPRNIFIGLTTNRGLNVEFTERAKWKGCESALGGGGVKVSQLLGGCEGEGARVSFGAA